MKAQLTTFFIALFFVNITSGQVFDFEEKATEAKWESSTLDPNSNALPGTATWLTLGKNAGAAGIAVIKDAVMEDGREYRVLHTHPKWSRNGTIKGWFPVIDKLPGKSILKGKIGFIRPNGRPSTDGARFMIFIHYYENGREYWKPIFDEYKEYTGSLESIRIDLSDYSGQKVFFELRVDTGESSGQDWAAWIDTKIDSDLVVIDRFNTGELCPNTADGHLVNGNRHFDGQVDAELNLEVNINEARSQIILTVDLTEQALANSTRIEAQWQNIMIYEAPPNKVISSFSWDCGYRNTSQMRVVRRCRELNSSTYTYRQRLPESGGEAKPFSYNDGEFKSIAGGRKSPIKYISLVGDTGSEDISDDRNCEHDSKILDIVFERLEIKLEDS
ncbi:hypothetical protein [Maribacter sp. 2210JD10-5]|uniref:hypothetical protein n=1 Tax=Maribacter sp. 2210JD10-5 TaxID=3386272 RepID=UPI0039BCC3DE